MLAGRLADLLSSGPDAKEMDTNASRGVLYELERLYYGTASSTSESSMPALLKLVPTQQVLFGTDYPLVDTASSLRELSSIDLSTVDRVAIESGNAETLMPRLKANHA